MNVVKTQIDPLNAELKVRIEKADYTTKVDDILKNYRKTANIPGFRKGQVPMGMIKKQYGKAVLVEEVNKLIQSSISNYLEEEKLAILGNPLPKEDDVIDWDAEVLEFDFELGLSPEFEVAVKSKKAITHYKIVADKKMLDDQIERIALQYGKLVPASAVEEKSEITAIVKNEEAGIENKTTFTLEQINAKEAKKAIKAAKSGDTFELKSKTLFNAPTDLAKAVGKEEAEVAELDITLSIAIEGITNREPAELNQELFDKLFGEGIVSSEEELRAKLTEDAESQFIQQADQKLLNDVTEQLVEQTKFDLPGEFLTKWIKVSGEKQLTDEEAKAEYEKAEQGLRYQLIEGKIINDNKLQIEFEELKEFAKDLIKQQMAQYGQLNPEETELDGIAARVMSNQDEVKRLQEQLMSKKLVEFYKENANLKTKELSYDKFVKEVYGA
jgi:trigger factor